MDILKVGIGWSAFVLWVSRIGVRNVAHNCSVSESWFWEPFVRFLF